MTLEDLYTPGSVEYEITKNSLEYGMAVNTDRAIPDAKSGLKPVATRIVYDAFIEGRTSDKPHVKSARIVGDVMGRFHPHGDSSIYGAMIRLSADWIMRYPLIDVHGNNGNILGDGPAAMRYTEARLSKIAEDGLLKNMKKNVVDYIPNYDETEEEPVTLPAIFPNLLCNPNEGIGWAMGCGWAPHNLNEVAAAIKDYLNGNEPMLEGPDFPCGGVVINKKDIPAIMRTGHGSVKIRAKYNFEKNNIVFYEIPYGTRVEALMDEIGQACDKGDVTGIDEIRNETNKKGIRLVITLDKGASQKTVLNMLFAKTNLQTSFSYNQVALVDKVPTDLNLKDAIKIYVNHNLSCIVREATFDKNKAVDRLHIVDGLLRALEDIDNIIAIIKKSESAAAAKIALIAKYKFSEVQAKAILDMKLSRLSNLEKIELENEAKELQNTINTLTNLIENHDVQVNELVSRLNTIVNKYGDARRTELTDIVEDKVEKEIAFVEPEKCVVVLTADGGINRIPISAYKTQKRNGKGVRSQGDIITTTIRTNTIDSLMVFTNLGRMYRILVNDIPSAAKGVPVKSLIEMLPNEEPNLIYSIYRDTDAKYLLFTTKNGVVKKTGLDEYIGTKKKSGIAAIALKDDDTLISVNLIKDEDVVILTSSGMGIRFNSMDVSATSRATAGVKGLSLKDDDFVAAAMVVRNTNDQIAIFSEKGLGKKIAMTDLVSQKRGGKGLIVYKPTAATGNVVAGALISDEDNILINGVNSSICIPAKEIPLLSRGTVGSQLIRGTIVNSISKV